MRTLDKGEADDKIIAVLEQDTVWGEAKELSDLPERLVERLRHYFSTYKMVPGEPSPVQVVLLYGTEHAFEVVNAAIEDYKERFGV
jgi:inorganic pyrophosphatase